MGLHQSHQLQEAAKVTPQHSKKGSPKPTLHLAVFWLAPAMTTKAVLTHLIKDTLFGVAPRPPIARTSNRAPQHNNKATPNPNVLLARFLAGPCHGHKTDITHLIKDTSFGAAPRPPIGRSSKSTTNTQHKTRPKAELAYGLLLGWPLPWPQTSCPYSPG